MDGDGETETARKWPLPFEQPGPAVRIHLAPPTSHYEPIPGSGVISWLEDETMEQASGRATQARAEFERAAALTRSVRERDLLLGQRSGVRQWLSVTAGRIFSSKVHASPSSTRL